MSSIVAVYLESAEMKSKYEIREARLPHFERVHVTLPSF